MTEFSDFQKLSRNDRNELKEIFGEVSQEVLSAFDTYTYGFSRTTGIQFVRKSMFVERTYDEETLASIAALIEKENQG